MATFRCTSCDHTIEVKAVPPLVCPNPGCRARGKFVKVGAASPTSKAPTRTTAPPMEMVESLSPTPHLPPTVAAVPSKAAAPLAPRPTLATPQGTAAPPPASDVNPACPPATGVSDERLLWRYRPENGKSTEHHPLRGSAAVDGQGRSFIAFSSHLVMLADGQSQPRWIYATGGTIPRSAVIGTDGIVRVHSTDGHVHFVNADGQRAFPPVSVGPPLGWATPLIDASNRTWIALADGGLTSIDAAGQLAARPYYRTRRRFDCTGVILGNVLYIGCEDHFVHAIALDQPRGQNRWNSVAGSGRTGGPISCPLAVASGNHIIAVSQDDRLYAFRADGSVLWSFSLPGQAIGAPVINAAGTILLGISQTPRNQPTRGLLLAIDSATHARSWKFETEGPIESTPLVGDDGIVYFGDNTGCVYALHQHGALAWRIKLDCPIRSAGALLAPSIVAFGLEDGGLVAIRCSSRGLDARSWPKFQGAAAQSGSYSDVS